MPKLTLRSWAFMPPHFPFTPPHFQSSGPVETLRHKYNTGFIQFQKWLKETGVYSTWKWLCLTQAESTRRLGYNFCFEFLPLCLSAHQSTNNRHLGIWSPLTKFSFLLRCQEIHPTVQLERKINVVLKINPTWIFKYRNRKGSWETVEHVNTERLKQCSVNRCL